MSKFVLSIMLLITAPAYALNVDIGDTGGNGGNGSPHHNTAADADANARAYANAYAAGIAIAKNNNVLKANQHQYASQYASQYVKLTAKQANKQNVTVEGDTFINKERKPAANVAPAYTSDGTQTGVSLSGRSGGLGFTWTARWAKTMQRSEYLRVNYGDYTAMAHDCNYAQFRRNIRDAKRAGSLKVDCSVFDKHPNADRPVR